MRGFGDRGGGGFEDRGGGGLRGVGSDDDDDDDTTREIDLLPTLTKRCTGTPLVPHPLVARIHNDSRDRYSTLSRERFAMLHSLSLERFATRRLVGRPSSSTRLCAPHHFHHFHIAASDGSVIVGDRSLARPHLEQRDRVSDLVRRVGEEEPNVEPSDLRGGTASTDW